MKQINANFATGHITEFTELQEAHHKVKAEYESLHQRMKSLDRRQIDTLPEGEYTVERKRDGVFVGAIGKLQRTWITPGGVVYKLGETHDPENITIGELYSSSGEGRRERIHGVLSALARGQWDSVRFHPFSLHERMPSTPKSNIGMVFDQYIERGAEGIIIREVNGSGIWKLKPKMNIDCVVIGYTEETAGEVKSLLCGLVRPDGCIQPLGAVGSNIPAHERKSIWIRLQSSLMDFERPMVYDGQSVQGVVPVVCVEISCNDIVTDKSDGSPIMKICYSNPNMRYTGAAPFCTLRGAYFERVRNDKSLNDQSGVTTKQVTDYVHIDKIGVDCYTLKAPEAQVIEESLFVKGDAVKRLLSIFRGEGNDPEYAVHLTDYSPNRTTPTNYEIQVTNDPDQAAGLYAAKADAIEAVRGWSRA
jgi:hypothetical protein